MIVVPKDTLNILKPRVQPLYSSFFPAQYQFATKRRMEVTQRIRVLIITT